MAYKNQYFVQFRIGCSDVSKVLSRMLNKILTVLWYLLTYRGILDVGEEEGRRQSKTVILLA